MTGNDSDKTMPAARASSNVQLIGSTYVLFSKNIAEFFIYLSRSLRSRLFLASDKSELANTTVEQETTDAITSTPQHD